MRAIQHHSTGELQCDIRDDRRDRRAENAKGRDEQRIECDVGHRGDDDDRRHPPFLLQHVERNHGPGHGGDTDMSQAQQEKHAVDSFKLAAKEQGDHRPTDEPEKDDTAQCAGKGQRAHRRNRRLKRLVIAGGAGCCDTRRNDGVENGLRNQDERRDQHRQPVNGDIA